MYQIVLELRALGNDGQSELLKKIVCQVLVNSHVYRTNK